MSYDPPAIDQQLLTRLDTLSSNAMDMSPDQSNTNGYLKTPNPFLGGQEVMQGALDSKNRTLLQNQINEINTQSQYKQQQKKFQAVQQATDFQNKRHIYDLNREAAIRKRKQDEAKQRSSVLGSVLGAAGAIGGAIVGSSGGPGGGAAGALAGNAAGQGLGQLAGGW